MLLYVGGSESNPFVFPDVLQQNVIMSVDGSAKGSPLSEYPKNFSIALDPLVFGLHAILNGWGSWARCLPNAVSSCTAKPFPCPARVVEANNVTGLD